MPIYSPQTVLLSLKTELPSIPKTYLKSFHSDGRIHTAILFKNHVVDVDQKLRLHRSPMFFL
jgi:hypothetical protein